jgi:hypothetical protein
VLTLLDERSCVYNASTPLLMRFSVIAFLLFAVSMDCPDEAKIFN